MAEFLHFLYLQALDEYCSPHRDWFGVCIAAFLNLLVWGGTVAGLVALVLWLDRLAGERSVATGAIIGKHRVAAYWMPMPITVGKVIVVTQTRIPEAFRLAIDIPEVGSSSGDFGEEVYKRLRVGDKVVVHFAIGRFTRRLSIMSIEGP